MLGLLVLILAACAQSPEAQKQKALERGEAYLRKGQYNEAIIEFRNALQVDPDFVPALHALGRAYEGRSWFFDAWRELMRAQKRAPDSVPIAVDLGKVLLEFGSLVTDTTNVVSCWGMRNAINTHANALAAAMTSAATPVVLTVK